MALKRTIYGIEYDPGRDDEGSSGTGWIVVAVLLVAAVSFAFTVARRIASGGDGDGGGVTIGEIVEPPPQPSAPSSKPGGGESEGGASAANAPPPLANEPIAIPDIGRRPTKVRSLLLKLDEAAKSGDLEMQISAIEQICALPPNEAAPDIASDLIPRLGRLNWSWLFDRHNPQWVGEVTVKRGDSATRIAQEHGSTLASLMKLNGLSDANRLAVGGNVKVMNHPRFNIVAHKRLRAVDLYLKGKLFKRYLLPDAAPEMKCAPGDYRTPANLRDFLRRMGIALDAADTAELDMLVPKDSSFNVTAL